MLRACVLLFAFVGPDDQALQDPARPVQDLLMRLPGVKAADVVTARARPAHRIVHILNWHYISRTMFAIDLRDRSGEPIPDEEIDRRYARFLTEVEAVQREQVVLIGTMIRQCGVRRVHYEGFSEAESAALWRLIDSLRNFEKHKPTGENPAEQLLLNEFQTDMLRIGAPGRLLMSGELEAVLPVDDARLLKLANPVRQNGTVRLDPRIIERRENAMVEHLLKDSSVSIVILGGAHDLSNNVPPSCEYVRVKTMRYTQAAEDQSAPR